MSESLSAQSQSDIFCFLCGEVCSQDLFLEHINECQNKSKNYVEYPINFYSIITKLSLKESIDYELKSYNYDAKKQFGINRKNTMATSDNESPSQLSWSNNSNVDRVYKEMKKRNLSYNRQNYIDNTSNVKIVKRCYNRLKAISHEDISLLSNLKVRILV